MFAIAESMALLLQKIDDPDHLTDIGEWLLDEPAGDTFLMRVRQLVSDKSE